ncbi:exonuclease domain-containing protein [Dermabacteraceae bacterium P13103]
MGGYLVIDVETTGFVPEKFDRILELAVLSVDASGEVEDEWSTLINPGRDVGATHIHGITASDVVNAPTFAEVADHLLGCARGRTLVAHNAPFDVRFLSAEIRRAGYSLPESPLPSVCTMRWAPHFVKAPSRRLHDLCSACGIDLQNAHSAHGDALATANLLRHYIRSAGSSLPWSAVSAEAEQYLWPVTERSETPRFLTRTGVREASPDAWLDSLVSRMPQAESVEVDSYLATLEGALLDGFLAEHEKAQLLSVAAEFGLGREKVDSLHRQYLAALAALAWEDGVVTDEERGKMFSVAKMLGVEESAADEILAAGQAGADDAEPSGLALGQGIKLEPGDRVCFTGAMKRQRSEWEQECREHGYVPGSLVKSTKLLVASDPNSLSGKAAKAKGWGIPIVTEDAFADFMAANSH